MPNVTPLIVPRVRGKNLWNLRRQNETPLGCSACPNHSTCGGMQIKKQVYSCQDFCCRDPKKCNKVCRLKPADFANRAREIDGWSLETITSQDPLPAPDLPEFVPLIDHGSSRELPFSGSHTVCLPFSKVVERNDGTARFASRDDLATHFAVSRNANIFLTGTDRDKPLERWWSMGVARRREAIRQLREVGVSLVTTQNYSLFTDVPRWDNLFNIKRIALVFEEFLAEGMPAGLHVNARTERDWERWIEFVRNHRQVTHIAYEFGTGAGHGERLEWHTNHLQLLAKEAGRPLHLVVRGGTSVLLRLKASFDGFTFIDTNAFTKTTRARQKAQMVADELHWKSTTTGEDEPLDDLLLDNWNVIALDLANKLGCSPVRRA